MDAPNRPRWAPTKFDRRRIRFASVGLLRTVPRASSMLAYLVPRASSHTPRLDDDFQAVDQHICPAKLSNAYRYPYPEGIEYVSVFYFRIPSIFLPRRYRFYIDLPVLPRHRYSFRKVSNVIRYLSSKVSINPASVVGLAIVARVSTTSASHTLPRCTTMVERRKNDDGGRDAPVSLGVRARDRTCDDQVDANEHQG